MRSMMSNLSDFYEMLGKRTFDAKTAKQKSRTALILYKALGEGEKYKTSKRWRIKPKMHLFQDSGLQ